MAAALGRVQVGESTPTETGRTIAVLGPSGGCGASTLAANIATLLAKEYKKSLLLDLKLEAGDLAALLDVKPTYTLADLCQNIARLDRAIFERCWCSTPAAFICWPHRATSPTRAASRRRGFAKPWPLAAICSLTSWSTSTTPSARNNRRRLRQADLVLLVLRLDFTSLRNTQRTLDYLRRSASPANGSGWWSTAIGQPKEVPAAKAEEALGLNIAHYVPDDPKTINRANNNGVPVVLESPSAKVSRSVAQLTMSINGKHKK